ncbi:MAG: 30S ribosomal protein S17 [Candidatus Diapherotrites archaeon]|nr:30S ribosomal protein S17 [Candidatus Diapherotrites archaeon]
MAAAKKMETEKVAGKGAGAGGSFAVVDGKKIYPVRGNIFEGKVVSAKANKTVAVERELTHYVRKYERYKKIKSKISAHNPGNRAKEGDTVRIGETRKISKTKSFVVMEILGEKK